MLLIWGKPFHEKSYGEAHMSRYNNLLLIAMWVSSEMDPPNPVKLQMTEIFIETLTVAPGETLSQNHQVPDSWLTETMRLKKKKKKKFVVLSFLSCYICNIMLVTCKSFI